MEPDRIISMALSAIAVMLSVYNFNRSRTVTMYQDVDRLYLELLKIAMANPDFVNPDLTSDYKKHFKGDQRVQYELYAFMVWNVCETIYDRKSIKSFYKTWDCIVRVENNLHRNWFEIQDNHCRFKDEFVAYVKDYLPNVNSR